MPEVDPVILKLEADIADYKSKVSQAQKLTDDKLGAIEARGKRMGERLREGFDLAKTAAIAYAASIGVAAITKAISDGLEYASSLGEQAQQLGVTTDALQEYRFAATQTGLSAEEMDQALGQLTRRIGEGASGTKTQAEAFNKLGISLKDAKGNVIATGEAIPLIADALQGIKSPAERAAILLDLFGKSGQKLEPLLAGGSEAINNLAQAARAAGAVLTPELIQNADDAADALARVKFELQASIAGAVAKNADAIVDLAKAFGFLIDKAAAAANAVYRFRLLAAQAQAAIGSSSPFLSPEKRSQEAGRARGYQQQLDRLDGRTDTKGSFRDYVAAPINAKSGSGFVGVGSNGTAKAPKSSAGGGSSGGGPSGPTAAETEQKYEDQLAAITSRILSALESAARTADERAEIQLRALEFDRLAAKDEIEHDKNFTAAQKADLLAANERLADRGREKIEFDRRVSLERDAADLAEEVFRGDQDLLGLQGDLADTQAERRSVALESLELEQRHQRAVLDAILASETAAEADKARARIALANLDATAGAKRESIERQNEGPLARIGRDAKDVNARIEEAAARRIDDLNATIADTMAKKLGIKDPFLRELLQIFLAKNVFGPLAEALKSAGGSGGGIGGLLGTIASGIGTIFGGGTAPSGGGTYRPARASGGYVAPGKTYRVNEGASPGRVEAFMSRDGGKIIPLGQMNALQRGGSQGGGMAIVRLELSGDIDARIASVSGPVAVQVVRASAPALIDASARETLSRAGRPRV